MKRKRSNKVKYHIDRFNCLVIDNYQQLRKMGYHVLTSYDKWKKKDGIIIGRDLLAGNRLDKWANHYYYIAFSSKGKLISTLHIENCFNILRVNKPIVNNITEQRDLYRLEALYGL